MSVSGVKRHNQSGTITKNTRPRHGGSRQGAGRMSNFARAQATAKRDLTQGKLNFTSAIESTAKAFPSLFDSSAQTKSAYQHSNVHPQEQEKSSPKPSSPDSEESPIHNVDTAQETMVPY
jgi:hypothetical protein